MENNSSEWAHQEEGSAENCKKAAKKTAKKKAGSME
jgi:hypothetical protein